MRTIVNVNGVHAPEKREPKGRRGKRERVREVLSVHVYIKIPTAYQDRLTGLWYPIPLEEVVRYFRRLTRKYKDYAGVTDGLNSSNPLAPAPYHGMFENDPPEDVHEIDWLFPAYLLKAVRPALKRCIHFLQRKYQQKKIFFSYQYELTLI